MFSVLGALLGDVELVAHHVAARLLERAVERRLEQVGVGHVTDLRPGYDPQPHALVAARIELARVVLGELAVRRADVAGVLHGLAVLLLAEDLPDIGVGAVAELAVGRDASLAGRLVRCHAAAREAAGVDRTAARTHAVWSWLRRRKSSRSWLL